MMSTWGGAGFCFPEATSYRGLRYNFMSIFPDRTYNSGSVKGAGLFFLLMQPVADCLGLTQNGNIIVIVIL